MATVANLPQVQEPPSTQKSAEKIHHSTTQPSSGNGRDKIHWSKEVWDRIDKADWCRLQSKRTFRIS
jgi:hypothetical protein